MKTEHYRALWEAIERYAHAKYNNGKAKTLAKAKEEIQRIISEAESVAAQNGRFDYPTCNNCLKEFDNGVCSPCHDILTETETEFKERIARRFDLE